VLCEEEKDGSVSDDKERKDEHLDDEMDSEHQDAQCSRHGNEQWNI